MPGLCHFQSGCKVTKPGSDADPTQTPLTYQASPGCCSSAPSKLAWLVETGVQYLLHKAAWPYLYAVAQSTCCLPAAGVFSSAPSHGKLWQIVKCAAYLMHWLPGRWLAAVC